MIVDDRLETVLRTVAAGKAGIRTKYRQLADLLGRTSAHAWGGEHHAALGHLDSLHEELGDAESAALLRSCAVRSPILVEHFAHRGPKVALAAIAHARLSEDEWLALVPALPVQARGFLRHRSDLGSNVERLLEQLGIDDFQLPLPEGYVATEIVAEVPRRSATITALPVPEPTVPESSTPDRREPIGAIVRRIEAFRRNRDAQVIAAADAEQSRLPFAEEPAPPAPAVSAIDVRIDSEGTITGAEASYAAMIVGHRPFTGDLDAPATCDAETLRAVRARLPVEAGLVTLEGAAEIAGPWRIDAVPQFAREGGHFLGYNARLRRPQAAPAVAPANDDDSDRSADRLRQLLHELRTPINAIQGFAELIQQQLFGATPHQYRSLAASIASDAARMLAGFEEVERLVKLETGLIDGNNGEADLSAILLRLVEQLEPVIGPREVKLRCRVPDGQVLVGVAQAELERTIWRMLSVIASAAAPGERLTIALDIGAGYARLVLPLPASLTMREDAALFAPDGGRGAAMPASSMLGSGFALRLAAAEVRAAGGVLARNGARISVDLPLLTEPRQPLSQGRSPAGIAR